MHRRTRFALAGLTAIATLGIAPAAQAQGTSGNDDIIKEGSCSGSSDWKLKVGTDDGLLDGEFEVDSNVDGQTWTVKISDNGVRVFSGTEVTQPPSGSFEIDFRTANQAGADVFKAKAANPSTGETCKASLTF